MLVMSIDRLRKCYKALEIIEGFHRAQAEELAEDIIENEDNFYLGGFGAGNDILDKYYARFHRIELAKCALRKASREFRRDIKMRNKDVKLKEDEFLCFACRNIVRRNDQECSECGFTWEI